MKACEWDSGPVVNEAEAQDETEHSVSGVDARRGASIAPSSAPPDRLMPARKAASELPGRLAGLGVRRQALVLAFWPFLEQLLGFCVGFVDTALAGRLSVATTEAIAVGAYVGWLLTLMFGAIGIGAGSIVSRAIGGRHRRLARAALGQALFATVGLAFFLFIATWLAASTLGRTMSLTGDAHRYATTYLRLLACGTPGLGILFVGSGCLRNAGDTRTPFFVLAIVNVVNVMTSLLFVYGPAPLGGHGAAGIAAGTVIAWYTGAGLIVGQLSRRDSAVRLFRHRLRPAWPTLKRILRISGPQFLDSLSMWTGNFILAGMVGALGAAMVPGALAAHIVVIRIEAMSFLPGWAIGQASATLVGQYLGLGDAHRARSAARFCWSLGATLMGLLGIAFYFLPEPLVSLLTADPEIIKVAAPVLKICGPVQIFLGTAIVLEQSVRGAGDTRPIALIVTCSIFLVRLPIAYLIGIAWGGGLRGIWIALCGELALRGTLIASYFLSDRWTRTKI